MSMYKLNQIPSEAQIRKYIRRIVFGKNVFCPVCRSQKIIRYEDRYRCRDCRIKFTLISHTWLKGMKLSWSTFWLILWCWTTQVPVKQAMALSRISEEATRRWYDLFRNHIPENLLILERVIQMDEAYGKGWALLMAKQKGTRRIAHTFIPASSVQRHQAWRFLQQYVRPRSRLYTDGAAIYQGIQNWWPVRHKRDIHRKFEFSKTSEIEGMFGVFRTFIRRMYHHTTAEKMPEIVREFCFRFSLPEMFENPRFYLQKSLMLVPFD